MLKKLILATIAGFVLVGGAASAAPPPPQQFNLIVDTGALTVDENSGNIRNTTKQKNVSFQQGDGTPLSVPFSLILSFWQSAVRDYDNSVQGMHCFPEAAVTGAIGVSETKNGNAKAVFWFSSEYDDGSNTAHIRYMLTLTADQWWTTELRTTKAEFPPLLSDPTAYMLAMDWEMETEGKGKDRNSSCKGSGSFPSADAPLLEVTQIGLDP